MVRIKDIPNYSQNLPFIENILSGIAKYITWILVHLPITGVEVTIVSIFFALSGAFLSSIGYFELGFMFFCVFILLDHVDGQVARFKKESGKAGIYLDSRTHYIVEPLYFIGIGIGAFNTTYYINSWLYFMAGIMAAVFYLMRQTLKTGDLGYTQSRSMKSEKSIFGKINYLIFDFIRINNPISLMMFAIFFNFIGTALCIYAGLFFLNVMYSFYKTYKSLKNEDINDRINPAT